MGGDDTFEERYFCESKVVNRHLKWRKSCETS